MSGLETDDGEPTERGYEKIHKESEIEQKCKCRKARIIVADEFAFTFDKICKSGIEGGEMGRILRMADSGANISGGTGYGGFRRIFDLCLSIVGYTQPQTWHRLFGAMENLDSGLIGRFFIVDMNDYAPIKVERLNLSQSECYEQIESLFVSIVDKMAELPQRVVCDFKPYGEPDRLGEIIDDIIAKPSIQAFVNQKMLDLKKLRGKFIYQALKYTMLFRALELSDKDRKAIAATEDENGEARTDLLRSEGWYRGWAGLLIANAIKVFCKDAPMSPQEEVEQRIINYLLKAKGNRMTLRTLQSKNLKLEGKSLRSNEIYHLVRGMEEKGMVKMEQGRTKNSYTVVWTGRR